MSTALLVVLAAFALGGVLGGSVMGRLRGVNLRAAGSGNIGATNALRTQGSGFALGVLAIDAGKGALAALLLPQLVAWMSPAPQSFGTLLPYACAAAAVFGHCFSPWHGFNGGKGVATLAGVFLALLPMSFAWMLLGFVLVVMLTGVVSLATLAGALIAVAHVGWFSAHGLDSPASAFAMVMLLVLLFTHRDNWRRLWAGSESRFERARLLGRSLRLPVIGIDRQTSA